MPIEIIQTPIGRVNKNNLNDLLVDISHAISDIEIGETSKNVKTRLAQIHSNMTEDYKKKQQKIKHRRLKEDSRNITPNKVEGINIEENIASKFFPNEYVKRLMHKKAAYQSIGTKMRQKQWQRARSRRLFLT